MINSAAHTLETELINGKKVSSTEGALLEIGREEEEAVEDRKIEQK